MSPAAFTLVSRGVEEDVRALLPRVKEARRDGKRLGGFVDLADGRVYLKGGPLRGKSRLRHALRASLLAHPLPALAEYANLEWLRGSGFGAPQPRAAGVLFERSLPSFQFVATRAVPDASPFRQAWEGANQELRQTLATDLGRLVARLHGRGFIHRDLFPRNILVLATQSGEERYVFLDAWRGGVRPGLRGPVYDLACFLARASALFDEDQARRFLRAYLAGRESSGHPLRKTSTLASLARQRRRVLRRELRRGRTDEPVPPPGWRIPDGI